MRLALCFLLVGCVGGVDEIAYGPDAGMEGDASTRAPEGRGCEVLLKDPAGVSRGRAGGAGGAKAPFLTCPDKVNDRMVGVAMRMSNQPTTFGGQSAHGMSIACARVTVGPTGTAEVGPVNTVEVSGLGTYDWSPSTLSPVTQCKPGWLMSGLLVHTGTSGNLFTDVSIVCSRIGMDGTPGASETIKVMGSLTDVNGPDDVRCAPGEVVVQAEPWTGAGLDAVELYCARPTCR